MLQVTWHFYINEPPKLQGIYINYVLSTEYTLNHNIMRSKLHFRRLEMQSQGCCSMQTNRVFFCPAANTLCGYCQWIKQWCYDDVKSMHLRTSYKYGQKTYGQYLWLEIIEYYTKDPALYMNPINLQDLNPRGIFFNSFRKHQKRHIISDNSV